MVAVVVSAAFGVLCGIAAIVGEMHHRRGEAFVDDEPPDPTVEKLLVEMRAALTDPLLVADARRRVLQARR